MQFNSYFDSNPLMEDFDKNGVYDSNISDEQKEQNKQYWSSAPINSSYFQEID
jgi:hypothetical protein